MLLLSVLFMMSATLIIYHHALYPAILKWLCDRAVFSEPTPLEQVDERDWPSVHIVVPAYNEEQFIQEKIRNLAILDYPRDRLSITVVCDGCTDNTALFASNLLAAPEFKDLRICIQEHRQNRGKLACLNEAILSSTADLVALSDVSALISMDAIKMAAQRFIDPSIGAVNSNYKLLNPGSAGEQNYWRYQNSIKKGEEVLGSLLGAHGAFYLIRRALFQALPEDTINDDFVLPMKIVEQGYRVVFEPTINAIELERSDNTLNWQRRVRIGMGNFQQIIRLRSLMKPKFKGVSFNFISGKGLRVAMPFLMVFCLISSLILSSYSVIYLLVFSIQCLVYLTAFYTWYRRDQHCNRIFNTIYYLVSGHAANLVGAVKYIFNIQRNW